MLLNFGFEWETASTNRVLEHLGKTPDSNLWLPHMCTCMPPHMSQIHTTYTHLKNGKEKKKIEWLSTVVKLEKSKAYSFKLKPEYLEWSPELFTKFPYEENRLFRSWIFNCSMFYTIFKGQGHIICLTCTKGIHKSIINKQGMNDIVGWRDKWANKLDRD